MQRKPGFPVANCSIKMPDSPCVSEGTSEEDSEQHQKRQQLINFGHSQWGFNNWSWAVTKQELDFVELTNGKYTAGVVAFVSITVKSFDIHRENIGYATSTANNKGFAIYKSRKCAVTNALRETLLSFGGSVATDLQELLEISKAELPTPTPAPAPAPEPLPENNQNIANKVQPPEVKNIKNVVKKEEGPPLNMRSLPVKSAVLPPVAMAHPMPAALPSAASRPRPPPPAPAPPLHRPNSNEIKLENMSEEEARAERKRRQRQAQEEFRQKQLLKHTETDESELGKTTLEQLLMEIPTQDIVIEQTGETQKRKSSSEQNAAKRRASAGKLDIVTAD